MDDNIFQPNTGTIKTAERIIIPTGSIQFALVDKSCQFLVSQEVLSETLPTTCSVLLNLFLSHIGHTACLILSFKFDRDGLVRVCKF